MWSIRLRARYPTIWNSGNGVEEEDDDEVIVPIT